MTDPGELPFYIDDPAVDRRQHVLFMEVDPVASAYAGCDRSVGTCSCGRLSTPPWPDYAIFEVYDLHMTDVQHAIHRRQRHHPQAGGGSDGGAPMRGSAPSTEVEDLRP